MSFGKSKARAGHAGPAQDHLRRTWPGSTRPVEELQEIKEFLAEPAKFQAIGR